MLSEEFKAAVGKFPTGVTVITASHNDKLWGFTANSFTSVSLDPNLISFCLDKKAASFEAFKELSHFAVNILSSNQADLSSNFARTREDKFAGVSYKAGKFSKAPIINGSISFIECKKYDQIDCGDHYIFIGEALNTSIDETKTPLLYFAKSYTELK